MNAADRALAEIERTGEIALAVSVRSNYAAPQQGYSRATINTVIDRLQGRVYRAMNVYRKVPDGFEIETFGLGDGDTPALAEGDEWIDWTGTIQRVTGEGAQHVPYGSPWVRRAPKPSVGREEARAQIRLAAADKIAREIMGDANDGYDSLLTAEDLRSALKAAVLRAWNYDENGERL